ncbi:hypothetical protein TBLA_0D00675 [Henningerozyma blattae CBS 6284]|uniref:S-formylglutathione hydrolase n=1 Tax=Henningerozyma blattae (strain ATCC 34711 / CBS 6284 / DSM 70876 / NBRC 10599 / NRRL Y-10934 / UCD 77-7) TaxID=1071380 RepID=I2H2H3_HENB6|nr:hypothetical protein TBLA_0D00675 [Tetrapisispora blattae CBS 6284]CCH60575.1 hypothetical protein TBLA_0D00675 [Tetrapisispora blattae CBS 6284]
MKEVKVINSCDGKLISLSHDSACNNCEMALNIYLPKQYYSNETHSTIPAIYYLSGLTCTPANASEKAFWQCQADLYGFSVVFPDTSPRGESVPDSKDEYDFGQGAGFYLNSTKEPYVKNYQMSDYIHKELPKELENYFQDCRLDFTKNVGITGHSMGGMGALAGFFKLYPHYKSVSAFSPIANPSAEDCPWGQKCFSRYLKDFKSESLEYDPCELIGKVKPKGDNDVKKILISVGTKDPFYSTQLYVDRILEYSKGTAWENKIEINKLQGFDHSYFFVVLKSPACQIPCH